MDRYWLEKNKEQPNHRGTVYQYHNEWTGWVAGGGISESIGFWDSFESAMAQVRCRFRTKYGL